MASDTSTKRGPERCDWIKCALDRGHPGPHTIGSRPPEQAPDTHRDHEIARRKPVTVEEAREIARRYNASHFDRRDQEQARYTIPADPERDDDFALDKFIEQYEELERRAGEPDAARGGDLLLRAAGAIVRFYFESETIRTTGPHHGGAEAHAALCDLRSALEGDPKSPRTPEPGEESGR